MANEYQILADQDRMNNLVVDWAAETAGKLKTRLPKDTGEASRRVSASTKKNHGEVERVAFKIPRYIVFVTKGVGRGRGINSGKAKPNPAFNTVLDEQVPKLSQLVTDNHHDRIINATRAYIK